MDYLALGLLAVAAAFIVLVPQPEPVLLMPEPRQSWLGRRRARRDQETFEDTTTIDWLVRVRLAADEVPFGVDRDGRVVTFRPDAPAEVIHHSIQQPPWPPATEPRSVWGEMVGPPRKTVSLPLPAPTADELAEQQIRRSIDRALRPIDPPPPDPEPESAPPEPEEPRAWQPGDPEDTMVRGIRAVTDDYLQNAPRYGDPPN